MSPARAEVVRVDDRTLPQLTEFIRCVWDPDATEAKVRAARETAARANLAAPGEDVPTFLFLRDGQAIGHLTTLPLRLAVGDAEIPAHWMQGFWVLPEHRNGPVGFLLLKESLRHLGCALSMAVEVAPRRLLEAFGFRDLGAVGNFIRVLRPGRLLRQLDPEALGLRHLPRWLAASARLAGQPGLAAIAGAGLAGASGLWTTALGRPGRRLEVSAVQEISGPASAEFDALWQEVKRGIRSAPMRDGRYVAGRYASKLGERYELLTAREASRLVGFAALRRPRSDPDPRLGGIRVAILGDASYPAQRPEVGVGLVRAAEESARQMDADALLCSASHPALQAVLRRRAFVPIPGNVHFLARDPEEKHGLASELAQWWVVRADGTPDEAF